MVRAPTLRSGLLRIIVVIAAGALLTIAGMTLLSVALLGRGLVERQQANVTALAHHGDQFLTDMGRLLRPVGAAALAAPPAYRAQLLREVLAASPEVHALYLLDSSGVVIADAATSDSLQGLDLSREPAFWRARSEQRPVISSPFLSPGDGQIAATVAIPFPTGVLLGELSLRELQAALSRVSVSEGEIIVIVDERGTVLAHPQHAWVQERRNLGDQPLFQDGLAGRARLRLFFDEGRGALMAGSATRMASGWVVITEQPLMVAARPLFWMLGGAAIAMGTSVLLAIIAQRRGLRQITEPITRLVAAADALAGGQPADLPTGQRAAFQELDSLGRSVARMARELQATIAALEQRVADIQRAEASLEAELAERRRVQQELGHSLRFTQSIVNTTPDMIYVYDLVARRSVYANRDLALALGYGEAQSAALSGNPFPEIMHPDDLAGLPEHLARLAGLADGEIHEREYRVRAADGSWHWLMSRALIFQRLPDGTPQQVLGINQDITFRKEAEARQQAALLEKETLLKEIHHRVKNNLQVVISLLRLQERVVDDARGVATLRESQQRIMTMALVHELLYQTGDLAHIDAAAYVRGLTDRVVRIYGGDSGRIAVVVEVSLPWLNLDQAVPCGLIINELLSNSLKYAFPSGGAGTVGVTLESRPPHDCHLRVWDTGIGLPEVAAGGRAGSLGMRLVQSLARQLRGDLVIERAGGTSIAITFPA